MIAKAIRWLFYLLASVGLHLAAIGAVLGLGIVSRVILGRI